MSSSIDKYATRNISEILNERLCKAFSSRQVFFAPMEDTILSVTECVPIGYYLRKEQVTVAPQSDSQSATKCNGVTIYSFELADMPNLPADTIHEMFEHMRVGQALDPRYAIDVILEHFALSLVRASMNNLTSEEDVLL